MCGLKVVGCGVYVHHANLFRATHTRSAGTARTYHTLEQTKVRQSIAYTLTQLIRHLSAHCSQPYSLSYSVHSRCDGAFLFTEPLQQLELTRLIFHGMEQIT